MPVSLTEKCEDVFSDEDCRDVFQQMVLGIEYRKQEEDPELYWIMIKWAFDMAHICYIYL